MYTTTLHFARHESASIQLAILTLKTTVPLSHAEALMRLKTGITAWIKQTDAGHSHWQRTYGTFSIEDLANLALGDMLSLDPFLSNEGISVQEITLSDAEKALEYDHLLVETSLGNG